MFSYLTPCFEQKSIDWCCPEPFWHLSKPLSHFKTYLNDAEIYLNVRIRISLGIWGKNLETWASYLEPRRRFLGVGRLSSGWSRQTAPLTFLSLMMIWWWFWWWFNDDLMIIWWWFGDDLMMISGWSRQTAPLTFLSIKIKDRCPFDKDHYSWFKFPWWSSWSWLRPMMMMI